MRRKRVQQQLFDDKLETPIVQAADRYIGLKEEAGKVKERLDVQGKNLIGLLKRSGKHIIRHGGFLIEVATTDAKDRLKLKKSKSPAQ